MVSAKALKKCNKNMIQHVFLVMSRISPGQCMDDFKKIDGLSQAYQSAFVKRYGGPVLSLSFFHT